MNLGKLAVQPEKGVDAADHLLHRKTTQEIPGEVEVREDIGFQIKVTIVSPAELISEIT
jgi:hypothetical protein